LIGATVTAAASVVVGFVVFPRATPETEEVSKTEDTTREVEPVAAKPPVVVPMAHALIPDPPPVQKSAADAGAVATSPARAASAPIETLERPKRAKRAEPSRRREAKIEIE
jgi:hypothetical protein